MYGSGYTTAVTIVDLTLIAYEVNEDTVTNTVGTYVTTFKTSLTRKTWGFSYVRMNQLLPINLYKPKIISASGRMFS